MSTLNPALLVSVHCYQGDAHQVRMNMAYYEHHQAPVVIVSPEDSPVGDMGPHWCRSAGQKGYTGISTWKRQKVQMQLLFDMPGNFNWFLMNDADSFCLTPKIPEHLFPDDNTLYSNLVNDFRRPGETSFGVTWPIDYHVGYPLFAAQPPYLVHRHALKRIIAAVDNVPDEQITPNIDWLMVCAPHRAGVKLAGLPGASCETITDNGRAVMRECIIKRGATFIHAIKNKEGLQAVRTAYASRLETYPQER